MRFRKRYLASLIRTAVYILYTVSCEMTLRSQCLESSTTGRHSFRVKSPTSLCWSLSTTADSTAADIDWVLVSGVAVTRSRPQSAAWSLTQRRHDRDDIGVVLPTSRSGVEVGGPARRPNRLRRGERAGKFSFAHRGQGADGWLRRCRPLPHDGDGLVTISPRTSWTNEVSPASALMTSSSDVTRCSGERKSISDCSSVTAEFVSVTSSTHWPAAVVMFCIAYTFTTHILTDDLARALESSWSSSLVGDVAQWLSCRSVAGRFSLLCA